MSTESKDQTGGMDPGDDEALWNLLGRQEAPVKASPYFARRVLREVALAEERRDGGGWSAGLRRFWVLPSRHAAAWSGAFALGVLCISAVWTLPASRPPVAHPAPAVAVATVTDAVELPGQAGLVPDAVPDASPLEGAAPVQDAELIADLDNLLSREESRLWTENTDTARF